jgi:hypothetical protein
MHPWRVLGIAPTDDSRAIKQAYARALKNTRPDSDPEGYQRLRECYEWALGWAERQRQEAAGSDLEDDDPSTAHHCPQAACADLTAPVAPVDPASGDSPEARAQDLMHGAVAAIDASADEEQGGPAGPLPPQALLGAWHAFWQDHGDAALVEALPQLRRELSLVPLEYGAYASALFAEWVVEQRSLPWSVVEALQGWFGWARDFRAERVLGTELTAALHERLGMYGLLHIGDGALAEHCRPLMELQRRQREQPAWRSLMFTLSLPGQLASLLGARASARGYLYGRVGEQGLSELRRAFFVLQALLLAGLGTLAFCLARVAGLDGLASTALAAGATASALAMAGFAPLLLVPLDAALHAVRETVPGPLEPGPVRSGLAIALAALALASGIGAFGAPTAWGWLGLSVMAVVVAWNPGSTWRSLLIPMIGVLALTLLHYFPHTLTPAAALSAGVLWVLCVDLGCQRLGLQIQGVQLAMVGLIVRIYFAIAWIVLVQILFGRSVLGPLLLIALLVPCVVVLLYLAVHQGVERVLAWLGACVLVTELLLPASPYRAFVLAASPALLWLALGTLSLFARHAAGPPPGRA